MSAGADECAVMILDGDKLDVFNAPIARLKLGITGGGAGGVAVSAGANSQSSGTVSFSNANGVSFGLNGVGVMTASIAPGGGAITNINVSAGTTSQNLSAFTFNNSNGVSFGLDAVLSVVTATVATNYQSAGAYLTTAMASNRGSDFVQATAAFAGTNASGTINSTGISVSVAAAAGQTVQPVAASASNGSFLFSTVAFSNANGVTFGTSAGSIISASVATNYQSAGAYLTTAMVSDAGSLFVNTSAGLNLTNISATFNSDSISLSVAAAAGQTVQPVAASASNGSFLFSTVAFSDANNVTFGTSAGSIITASVVAAVAQSTQPVAASASNGSFLFSTVAFSNANNVTFGTSAGSIITASVAAAVGQSIQPVAASASNGSFLFSTVGFSNANGVTFGTSAGSIITASVAAGAQSTQPVAASASNGSFLFSTLGFSNANNVTFGTSAGSIITASVAVSVAAVTISSYEPFRFDTGGVGVSIPGNSFSSVVGFLMPLNISVSYLRLPVSMSINSTTETRTVASMNASVNVLSTWNAVVYKMNTGASSLSLTWVASGQALWTMQNSMSVAANGTQESYSQSIVGAVAGNPFTFSTQYSISHINSYIFSSTAMTDYTGTRFLDINFANSLSAGYYFLMVGLSTNSATNSTGISAASNCGIGFSRWFVGNQSNLPVKVMGSTDVASIQFAAGSFSTVGGGTTAELAFSKISTAASNPQIYFQMLRFA